GSPGFTPGAAIDFALAVSSGGVPHVAFSDEDAGGQAGPAHVMRWSGSTWQTVGAAGFSSGVARSLNIAIAGDGSPYVAFTDEANMSRATVMRFNGSAWANVGKA